MQDHLHERVWEKTVRLNISRTRETFGAGIEPMIRLGVGTPRASTLKTFTFTLRRAALAFGERESPWESNLARGLQCHLQPGVGLNTPSHVCSNY